MPQDTEYHCREEEECDYWDYDRTSVEMHALRAHGVAPEHAPIIEIPDPGPSLSDYPSENSTINDSVSVDEDATSTSSETDTGTAASEANVESVSPPEAGKEIGSSRSIWSRIKGFFG